MRPLSPLWQKQKPKEHGKAKASDSGRTGEPGRCASLTPVGVESWGYKIGERLRAWEWGLHYSTWFWASEPHLQKLFSAQSRKKGLNNAYAGIRLCDILYQCEGDRYGHVLLFDSGIRISVIRVAAAEGWRLQLISSFQLFVQKSTCIVLPPKSRPRCCSKVDYLHRSM
jgi:hypothetical protein